MIERANGVFAPTGIQFWLQSNEAYFLTDFSDLQDNQNILSWADVKGPPVGHNMRDVYHVPNDAYEDSSVKTMHEWQKALSAAFGNDDELIVWVMDCGTPTGGGCTSDGATPEQGRMVRLSHASQVDASGATSLLAHELGHYFGLRHASDKPREPKCHASALTCIVDVNAEDPDSIEQNLWDLLYCPSEGGPLFDQSSLVACHNPEPILAGASNCSGQITPPDIGVVTCTNLDGETRSSDESTTNYSDIKGIAKRVGGAYGVNVMHYYGSLGLLSVQSDVPAFLSDSQKGMVGIYSSTDVEYLDCAKYQIRRQDCSSPTGAVPGWNSSRRTTLGTSADDILHLSNGDLTFSRKVFEIKNDYTPVAGDFDGDGRPDIAWYDAQSETANLWWGRGDGTFRHEDGFAFGFEPCAQLHAGSFGIGSRSSILCYSPGRTGDALLTFDDTYRVFGVTPLTVSGTYRVAIGDFDGSGIDDIAWYDVQNGVLNMWWGQGAGEFIKDASTQVASGYELFSGDFDGSSGSDLFWYAAGAAQDFVWYSRGQSGTPWYIEEHEGVFNAYEPLVGDFDGDGADDIFWNRIGSPSDFIWRGQNLTGALFDKSAHGSIAGSFFPVVGDFDSSGTSDIFWYRR